jgi:hypothetical protein
MFLNRMRVSGKLLCAGWLGALAINALAQDHDQTGYRFVPAKLRSEYLKMPATELAPMLDWLADAELNPGGNQPAKDRVAPPRVTPLLVHGMLLRGRHAEALSLIAAARLATDKPLQRDMLFFTEELLARALIEGWDEPRFAAVARQRVSALPWPAARSGLKALLHPLDIPPFEQTLATAANLDPAYRLAPLNSPNLFASNVVETRFHGEILGPRAASLRQAIKATLDARAGDPNYWQLHAYPPLRTQGQTVRVAVWEPDGVDIALFKHPQRACLVLAPGRDCLIDPQIDGVDRSQRWAFVQGYRDVIAGEATPEAQAWEAWRGQLAIKLGELSRDAQDQKRLIEAMQHMGRMTNEVADAQFRQHGTHVAGIVTDGNPFVELVAIRDARTLAAHPNLRSAEWEDRFGRIADFLRANQVRVVNMSWGMGTGQISPAHAAAFEKHMLALMAALPDTLFVAAAGNDDQAIDKSRFLPASLSAANLLTVGAVDQDGQVTSFTNTGASVALYANGDMVRSVGPGGYRLEMSGTSMAAPQVCNVAAKLLSQHPGLPVAALKRLLLEGADELPAGEQLAAPIKLLNPAHSAALAD